MHMSREAVEKLTAPWEEFVPYPYDDKIAKRRINGKLEYPEWTGGPLKGTATLGLGHTDAAGDPKVVPGVRLTEAQGYALLDRDLAPCVARVNAALKVAVTQHQFDALVDLDFNCPSAIPHVTRLVNAGDWPGAEHVMLQFVMSRGERMAGLVNRRHAEIIWANTPDDPEEAAVQERFTPKAERTDPPKGMVASKQGTAAIVTGAGGVIGAIQAANEAAEPIKQARNNLAELGLLDHLVGIVHSPALGIAVGVGIAALAVFIWLNRRFALVTLHV